MKILIERINKNYKTVEIVVYGIIFLLALRLINKQILFGPDYSVHINIINQYFYENFYIPHPGFHILIHYLSNITSLPYNQTVTIVMAIVITITIKLTETVLKNCIDNHKDNFVILFGIIAINIAIALYIPSFNKYMYAGQWSPNIWHSPTLSLLKPFALLSFFLLTQFLKKGSTKQTVNLILCSLLLFIGTFIKPSFIICLIPALFFYLVIFRFKQSDIYLKLFYVILPSLLLLTYQYFETYNLKDSQSYFHDKIVFTWFGVMKMYTPNLFISTILATAFPLLVLLFSLNKIKRNTNIVFSWILIIVSYLISGMLAEQNKFSLGAFIFSYDICLYILYVFSFVEYINWFKNHKNNMTKLAITSIVLSYHIVCGILYVYGLLKYGTCEYIQ